MERPLFPDVLDNSLLSSLRSCPRKVQLEYLEHWKPNSPNIHLHAGGAFAHGCEAVRMSYYVSGETSDVAVARGVRSLIEFYGDFECPADSVKSMERMCGALVYYFDNFPLETEAATPVILPSGKRGIEFSFLEPMGVSHPETGAPLLYSGRFDMLADYAGGVFGEDDKTASQLGATWPNQWPLRAQFTGYAWGAAKAGRPIQGMLVRAVSILKTKYDHASTVTYRPQWMIDRWEEQTYRDVTRLIRMWEEGYFDYNLDDSCNAFGGCIFKSVCQSPEPEKWLAVGFERRKWDPVERTETPL